MRVFIDNVILCNNQGDPLPFVPEIFTYLRKFSPTPLGDTGKLFFKIFFTFIAGSGGSNDFFVKASIRDPDLYLFTENNDDFIELQFKVNKSENPVLLEFKLKNLKPLSQIIPARLVISTRTENSSQKTILLKGNN